jgi:hypothetical protein
MKTEERRKMKMKKEIFIAAIIALAPIGAYAANEQEHTWTNEDIVTAFTIGACEEFRDGPGRDHDAFARCWMQNYPLGQQLVLPQKLPPTKELAARMFSSGMCWKFSPEHLDGCVKAIYPTALKEAVPEIVEILEGKK